MIGLHLLLVLALSVHCGARMADDVENSPMNDNCIKENCFHQPESACPSPDSKCRCRQLPSCKRAAVCCNVNHFQLIEGLACANISTLHGVVDALHIRNASLDILNVSQPAWRRLRYMTITDGRINSVVGEFAKHSIVSCLNLSSNGIVNFEDRSLVNLYKLNFLDLSHNNLSEVPRFKKEGNITLDICNNKPLLCTEILEALKRTGFHFGNLNDTFCLASKNFEWFNSIENVPLSQIIAVHELRRDCRSNCSCEPTRMNFVMGKFPSINVAVKCVGLGLTSLPTPLPTNTINLNVANNNITSLELIGSDPSYENLKELVADNNQITSILPLEGSKFISKFVALSLKNNKIKYLPTYIFSNVFDRNNYYTNNLLYLGNNYIQCDCNTAKSLQVWLLSKTKQIPDYDQIFCDDSTKSQVIHLNPSNYCQSKKQDWTDYIYYIITAEVLLLVGLISKVCYDYWVFKTSGYLPWPASKMPRLPCDWLCE